MSSNDDIKGNVRKLKDLIDYQEHSVVSKELVKKDTGTITIFAFDKDEQLSEHSAPFDALVQIIDGKAEITIDGNKKTVKEGEILLMPANHPHALKAVEKYKMILTMIKS